MRRWLEREAPLGDDIVLPEGSGSLVFGRSSKSTLVFEDSTISPRHCELTWDAGLWKLKDLGSDTGTYVNGHKLTHARSLFHGDAVQFGSVRLRFKSDEPPDDSALLSAIERSPDDEAAWLVYADSLQDRGDPLGERIVASHTCGRLDHMPWMGSLWGALVLGELEVDWAFGFIKKATLRTVAGRNAPDWREMMSALTSLRVGRFLRHLVIDLPRLAQLSAAQLSEEAKAAQGVLAKLERLPTTLERISLGYHVAPGPAGGMDVDTALVERCPRLKGTSVYQRVEGLRLRLLSVSPGISVSGVDGTRGLSGVTRIRRGSRHQLFIESPPGIPFMADGNPCYFSFNDGRAQLFAGRMRGEIRVNTRIDALYSLLPDDVIEVQGAAKFIME